MFDLYPGRIRNQAVRASRRKISTHPGVWVSMRESGTLMNMSCWYLLLLHLYVLTFARKLGSLDWLKTYFTGFSFIWWSNSTKIMFSVGFPNQTNPLNHTFRWLASRCFVFPTGYLHVPGLMWWSYPMTFRFLQMVQPPIRNWVGISIYIQYHR